MSPQPGPRRGIWLRRGSVAIRRVRADVMETAVEWAQRVARWGERWEGRLVAKLVITLAVARQGMSKHRAPPGRILARVKQETPGRREHQLALAFRIPASTADSATSRMERRAVPVSGAGRGNAARRISAVVRPVSALMTATAWSPWGWRCVLAVPAISGIAATKPQFPSRPETRSRVPC